MSLSVNPYAGQAQAATLNPFQQRSEDPVRTSARQQPEKTNNDTRPADVSAARAQHSETRNNRNHAEPRIAHDNSNENRQPRQRGSLVDISV